MSVGHVKSSRHLLFNNNNRYTLPFLLLIIFTCFSFRKHGCLKVVTVNDGFATSRKCEFNFLIVVDFESTCWEKRRGNPEIIEFSAVLLDLSNGEISNEFQQFVTPVENPQLTSFCTNLTGR